MIVVSIIVILLMAGALLLLLTAPKKTLIPFKESVDLIDLPVVTFTNNNTKLHFLLDTGSDESYINSNILDKLEITQKYAVHRDITTGSGNVESNLAVALNISYGNQSFRNIFIVSDFEEAFNDAVGTSGITIHGILGSKFFANYKYILDYVKLAAYSKK